MVSPLAISKAVGGDRMRDFGILAALVSWLVYTRVFWSVHAAHFILPPCPFYYLTGHPCPFCGGTRSFAYMWQGDLADAVRLYPLGPAMFLGTLIGAGGLASGVITGRTWSLNLSSAQWRVLAVGVISAIALSWALKVFVLGN